MNDQTLQQYIHQVWNLYDVNQTNKMEPAELHWFFNDLFQRIGDNRRYNPAQILLIFKQADINHDGHVDKTELFRVCKMVFQKSPYVGTVTTYSPPINGYSYTYHSQRPNTYQTTTVYHH